MVAGQGGGKAKLELSIVGRDKAFARFGNKAAADALAIVASNRDILQVWIDARKAAGGRDVLSVSGVNTMIIVGEGWKWINVSTEQFPYFAVALDQRDNFVLIAELVELLGACRIGALGLLMPCVGSPRCSKSTSES